MAQTISRKAYDILQDQIMNGVLRAGAPLDIHRIAAGMEMSITPVRDAIKKLEADGLVEVIPRSGTFVRHYTIEDLIKGYELVEGLDGMAGYLLAEKVEAGLVAGVEVDAILTPLVDEMERHLSRDQVRTWAELDDRFHRTIFDMAENPLLANAYNSARNQMRSVLSFISPVHVDRANSVKEHRLIVAAIAAGDCEQARKTCQDHRHLIRQILKTLHRECQT
ncbi:GntR family transcriptional regulator [Ponticoccus alexandrii]|uniref:FCD domain-containing protein n=1 Tax=Ponticoccus alexandrii TaxID=1943633 RepID=A0ABX7FGP2_9RHOB|nr:GntR family transcriptional regulator [Ponticoccus alexandrii]QRF69194.1 FCD domain-containing protein [Ponticoccus alexandrii]